MNDPIVVNAAWLMWCYSQGYVLAEDRAILTNWLGDDPATLHPDDVETQARLLEMAAEIVTQIRSDLGEWDMAPGHG